MSPQVTILGEILTIGDEILQGRTVNGNAAYIGRSLVEAGVDVRRATTTADRMDEIIAAVRQAMTHADIVVITGGLGPTPDDLTRDALSSVFEMPLVVDPEQQEHVEGIFKRFGRAVPPVSENQFLVLQGATRIHNQGGTAAGIHIEKDGKHLFALPGVPQEMRDIIDDYVIPVVREAFPEMHRLMKTLRMAGIGESLLVETMGDLGLIEQYVELAYLPNHGLLDVRLTARSNDPHEAEFQIASAESIIRECAGEHVYGLGAVRIERVIGDILLNRCQKLAVAESCTGGLICSRLTDIPGSSNWFERGFITYSNRAKNELLSVPNELIQAHGAVSEQVAVAMAEGARINSGAHWSTATTGIAGPDGGTPEKPVGTVWIAISSENETHTKLLQLGAADRERVKLRATHLLLYELYKSLIDSVE